MSARRFPEKGGYPAADVPVSELSPFPSSLIQQPAPMSDGLRDRLAAALSDKVERGATFSKLDAATDAVLAVFEAKLVAVIHGADDYGKELKAERDAALATLARVRELHRPARGGRSGWNPDDDDTPGAYGHIESACEECGSQDMAVRWPCPTVQAIDAALVGPAGAGSTQDGA